ncbi:hypothetical protein GCM10017083_41510 [Thalassobaculum fulvum]|uniref:ABC transporter domain-containing protein n=1 Tax=Thalassobaculum fulvum TaxID=1633335 RepID=A0A918XV16_9PROT|nr:ATP-binding cassette domain-containing protein [Thalassobaculum fulvum]GHD58482.1 hypothetical protein GCM10017083_41510 [Thalassobaculum fulvum]
MLKLESDRFSLRARGKPLLQFEDASYLVTPPLWLSGASGSGKSLLCRAFAGLLPLTITCDGHAAIFSARDQPEGEWQRPRIVYIPQSPASALPTAIRCIDLFNRVSAWSGRDAIPARARDVFGSLGLDADSLVGLQAHQLSGGMAQRFAIALAIAARPEVLILDEPTVGLDPKSRSAVLSTLNAPVLRRIPLLIVSHDQAIEAFCADRLTVVRDGSRVDLVR